MAQNEKTNPFEMAKKKFAIAVEGQLRSRETEDSIYSITDQSFNDQLAIIIGQWIGLSVVK